MVNGCERGILAAAVAVTCGTKNRRETAEKPVKFRIWAPTEPDSGSAA